MSWYLKYLKNIDSFIIQNIKHPILLCTITLSNHFKRIPSFKLKALNRDGPLWKDGIRVMLDMFFRYFKNFSCLLTIGFDFYVSAFPKKIGILFASFQIRWHLSQNNEKIIITKLKSTPFWTKSHLQLKVNTPSPPIII